MLIFKGYKSRLSNTLQPMKNSFMSTTLSSMKLLSNFQKAEVHMKRRGPGKSRQMRYPCIPEWMKANEREEFGYKLRSLDEISEEQYITGATVLVEIEKQTHRDIRDIGDTTKEEIKYDMRNEIAKVSFFMNKMSLGPSQKKRLIFLLGNRYKGQNKITFTVKEHDNFKQNVMKGYEIIKQLYFEAKRAPPFDTKLPTKVKRYYAKKYLGRTKEERHAVLEEQGKVVDELKKEFVEFNKKKHTREEFSNIMKKKLEGQIVQILENEGVNKHGLKPGEVTKEYYRIVHKKDIGNPEDTYGKSKEDLLVERALKENPLPTKEEQLKNPAFGGLSDKAYDVFFRNNSKTPI